MDFATKFMVYFRQMDELKHVEGKMRGNSMINVDLAFKGSQKLGIGGFKEVLHLVCRLDVEFLLLIPLLSFLFLISLVFYFVNSL